MTTRTLTSKANIIHARYWIGDSGNWNDTAHWAYVSGGDGGASAPIGGAEQKELNAIFDENSFTDDDFEVTVNVTAYPRDINCSGVTKNFSLVLGSGRSFYTGGSVILSSKLTISATGTNYMYLQGTEIYIFDSAGISLNGLAIDVGGGATWYLNDDIDVNGAGDTGKFILSFGTLYTNNHDLTGPYLGSYSTMSAPTTLIAGTSTFTVTKRATNLGFFSVNGNSSNNELEDSTVIFVSVDAGDVDYLNCYFNGASLGEIRFQGPGEVQISGAYNGTITIDNFIVDDTGKDISFFSHGSAVEEFEINQFSAVGAEGDLIYIHGSTADEAALITGLSINGTLDYVQLKDIEYDGPGPWYAGLHSEDLGNTPGWQWTRISSITSKANIKGNQIITSKAKIVCITQTELVTPTNLSLESTPAYFVWEIPTCCKNRNIHAHVQIDKTDDTFGDLEKDLYSYKDSDFEYWDGGEWKTYPTAGVTSAYYGNQARVQVSLTDGNKWWRVRGGVK